MAETDLKVLLSKMQPLLHEQPYVFCTLSSEIYSSLPFECLGSFREQEGVTVIITQAQADEHGLPYESTWACITLRVHSSLSAVGFLAAITTRLAAAGIGVNPVSAYYHDHLFVPWERRQQVLEELFRLAAQDRS